MSRPSLPVGFVLALALVGCSPGGDGDTTGGASTTSEAGSETEAESESESEGGSGSDSDTTSVEDPFPGALRVMSFNVLCSFCSSDFDPWDDRVPWIADTIARHEPALVGLQELTFAEEVDEVLAAVPGYAAIYWDPDEGAAYPDATVLYREALFEPVDVGFYWLSPTPDLPMSKGFADGFQLARLVTWAILRRLEDDAELLFATTHFDNNPPSQELSAPLVLERTAPLVQGRPGVLVGDYNSKPDSVAYATLTGGEPLALVDAFELAPQWAVDSNMEPPLTYDTSTRIDHVLVTDDGWRATRWVVDTWVYGPEDNFVSDHFAIMAELERG